MTEIQQLDRLINNDPEYISLIAELNAFTKLINFPKGGATLYDIKAETPAYEHLKVEKFFAIVKCMLAWAIMISDQLNKLHGKDDEDKEKMFSIGEANDKFGLIHYTSQPDFYFTAYTSPTLYIAVPIRIIGGMTSTDTDLTLALVGPKVVYDPATSIYKPDLKNSMMKISIVSGVTYAAGVCTVQEFNPSRLSSIIDMVKTD